MTANIFAGIEKHTHQVDGRDFQLPIFYHRLDSFLAVYTADFHAARALIPSVRLDPVKIWPGRTAAALMAYNYLDTDIGAYGEFAVAIPCFCHDQGQRLFGFFVQRLPVTTQIALDYGVKLWGYPKFLSEMEFKNDPTSRSLKLTAEGQLILELSISKSGIGVPWTVPTKTFTIRNNEIIFTEITTSGITRGMPQALARLNLGAHPMAQELAGMRLGARPLFAAEILDSQFILPEGRSLGKAMGA
jgi:hypothetical protein